LEILSTQHVASRPIEASAGTSIEPRLSVSVRVRRVMAASRSETPAYQADGFFIPNKTTDIWRKLVHVATQYRR
jgi:hypothetical protein